MSFLTVLLRGLALLPSVVQGVETLYGAKAGRQKRRAAVAILSASLDVAEAAGAVQIGDPVRFAEALGVIVDGVVACLNASVWSRAA